MSIWIILLLALLFVTVGFIGGVLVALLFADREQKQLDSEEDRTSRKDHQELARLHRERSSGRLVIEWDDSLYFEQDPPKEKIKNQMINLAREWLLWLGVPEKKEASLDAVSPQATPAVEPLRKAGEPVYSRPKQVDPIPGKETLAAVGLNQPSATTIVGQIDEILQEKLASSPLAGRRIKLAEDLKNGVLVWVDTQQYIGIDTVEDPEIKNAIREAVSEWERRSDLKTS